MKSSGSLERRHIVVFSHLPLGFLESRAEVIFSSRRDVITPYRSHRKFRSIASASSRRKRVVLQKHSENVEKSWENWLTFRTVPFMRIFASRKYWPLRFFSCAFDTSDLVLLALRCASKRTCLQNFHVKQSRCTGRANGGDFSSIIDARLIAITDLYVKSSPVYIRLQIR